MKKIHLLLIAILICFSSGKLLATLQPCIDLGIFNAPAGSSKLEIRLKPTINLTAGNYSAGTFVIKYLTSYNVDLTILSSPFGYAKVASSPKFNGNYTYYVYTFAATNLFNPPGPAWTAGDEVVILNLDISDTGVGNGIFELTTDAFAKSITGNDPFYQEMAANGENGGENGQQNIFYQASVSAPLPVELMSFNATGQSNNEVLLDWEAAIEKDLSYYGIEYSPSGLHYSQIGAINATGTLSQSAKYFFIHTNAQVGSNYYRLRMVNLNGSFEYSPLRSVTFKDRVSGFELLPNPTAGPLELISHNINKYASTLRYQLTDNNGKLLLENQLSDETTKFDLSRYPGGYYFLSIWTDLEQIEKFRVVVTPK